MPPIDSEFTVQIDHAGRLIHASGEFDVASKPALATAIAAIQQTGPGDITIDLNRVTFIDMAGIGTIVAARNAQAAQGCRLHVTGAHGRVRRTFGLANDLTLLSSSSAAA